MSNYNSCFSQNSKTKMAKLVDSRGTLRLVDLPTTVAELMLENPGFAISKVEEVRLTHRTPAMRADDSLVGGKVYLLVPVDKVNSRLTELQLAAIDTICFRPGANRKRTRGGSKVSPDVATGLSGEKLGVLEKEMGGCNTAQACQMKRVHRAWTPVLEPIREGC